MIISPEQLVPSQDFLKPKTIQFIFGCMQNNELDQLPPAPIVRRTPDGELLAIDGHNLIAAMLHRGESLEVHIADSPNDGLPATSDANIQRNADLQEKFDLVLAERARLRAAGIVTFNDLIGRYPELFEN